MKVILKHMQHISRKVEEEISLVFKEEMEEEEVKKEDQKKKYVPLKERKTCQRFNAINVTTSVSLYVIVLKDQMIEREKWK